MTTPEVVELCLRPRFFSAWTAGGEHRRGGRPAQLYAVGHER